MELPEKGTKKSLKEHNRRLVLQAIYNNEPITRGDISERTTLTGTTVTEVVNDAKKEKLIAEKKAQTSSLGRTPTVVSFVKDARYIIAVDVSETTLRAARINLRGDIKQSLDDTLHKGNADDILNQIIAIIEKILGGSRTTDILGIGLSITGIVNPITGELLEANRLHVKHVPLKERLRGRFSIDRFMPVSVMNNGQALALGEFGSFADKSITDLIVIRTGEGIGGGLIHNGEINHGNNYGAGEFGKISVAYDEARNEHVHLTTVATDEMILKRARKLARQDPNRPQRVSRFRCIEDICQAASKNDGVARQVIEETGRYFGRAICNLVSINSVRNIIVSGRISAMGKSLQTAIEDEVKKLGMSEVAKKTVIDIVPENPNTSLIGAATPLLTHAFGIPRFVPDRS